MLIFISTEFLSSTAVARGRLIKVDFLDATSLSVSFDMHSVIYQYQVKKRASVNLLAAVLCGPQGLSLLGAA